MLQLYIGNKNYSSWSMRSGVLLAEAGIAFQEVMVRFDSFAPGSQFRKTMDALSPVGKVPVLVDGDLVVWDTLRLPSTWPSSFRPSSCGRQRPAPAPGRAASAPKCTAALSPCGRPAP